ncbi:AAA family ATPase [Microcella sp.]|uniref:AAA family ATPase n=1 Tax=Microcella sp. TaxID=1913979 RepID=UPI003F70996B
MLIALAVPGLDADTVELAVLRAGHRVAWRAIDQDEVLTQLAQRAPDIVLLADHPAVATATVVGSCDLLGVRSCLVVAAEAGLSVGAQRLGLHDVLRQGPDGSLDLGAIADAAGVVPLPAPPAPPTAESLRVVPSSGTTRLAPDRAPRATEPSAPSATPTAPASRDASRQASSAPIAPAIRAPRVITVWGPAGAPGRTTLAIGLAAELAARGHAVCLVDADTYGGTVAPALGLLDESPAFAAACRLAGADALTPAELDRVAQSTAAADGAAFAVLTGIGRPHRWPELSSGRVTAVLEQCRRWRDVVVVDAGFSIESDEEVSSDLLAPRRNAATIAALRAADDVIAVGAADPLGLARLLRTHADLLETVDTARVRIAVNRVRSSVLGIDPHGQVRQTLDRFAGIRDAVLIDDDRDAADAALLTARPVPVAAPRSSLSRGIAELADVLGFAREPATGAGPRWARPLSARPFGARRGSARAAG